MSTSTSDLHSSRDLKDWSTPSTAGAKDAMVAEGGEHLWTMPWNDAAMMLDSGWQRWRRQQAHSCFGHITSHSLHQGQMLQMLPAKPLLMPCQCGPHTRSKQSRLISRRSTVSLHGKSQADTLCLFLQLSYSDCVGGDLFDQRGTS